MCFLIFRLNNHMKQGQLLLFSYPYLSLGHQREDVESSPLWEIHLGVLSKHFAFKQYIAKTLKKKNLKGNRQRGDMRTAGESYLTKLKPEILPVSSEEICKAAWWSFPPEDSEEYAIALGFLDWNYHQHLDTHTMFTGCPSQQQQHPSRSREKIGVCHASWMAGSIPPMGMAAPLLSSSGDQLCCASRAIPSSWWGHGWKAWAPHVLTISWGSRESRGRRSPSGPPCFFLLEGRRMLGCQKFLAHMVCLPHS